MKFDFFYATVSGRWLRRHKVVHRQTIAEHIHGRPLGFDYEDVSYHFTMGAAHKRARQLNRKQGVTA